MTTREMLQAQFDLIYTTVEAYTAGLSEEDSLASPREGGNCANWILGHLTSAQNSLMQLLGAEPVWTDAGLERDWNEPVMGAGQLARARRVAGHPGVFRQPEG